MAGRSPRRAALALAVAGAVAAIAAAPGASGQGRDDLPVLAREVPAGTGTAIGMRPVRPARKRVDGRIDDWRGVPTRFGGTAIYSRGELVYQDHLFDAYGPDDGRSKRELSVYEPLAAALPELYRIDPALRYVPAEFGVPIPEEHELTTTYGALPHTERADLSELRAATDRRALWLLARTTTMRAVGEREPPRHGSDPSRETAPDDPPGPTALLALIDTAPGGEEPRDVPFGSGLTTKRAEWALLAAGDRGWLADLRAGGDPVELPAGSVRSNPEGFTNAIEARVPFAALGHAGPRAGAAPLALAAGAGIGEPDGARLADLGAGPELANVAFRTREPARNWWDRQQALTLGENTIDPFFHDVDLAAMARGRNERYEPGPGYHDRLFESDPRISEERDLEGTLQHYGLYLPTGYRPTTPSPLQLWLHFRGGTAHIAAAAVPRLFEDLGEEHGTIVVTPRGRGTSRWYVGKGHVDFLEVWRDVQRSFAVDRDRTYVSGHSMGGWGSYLLSVLYPDRFAASLPASAPVTQGAWTGLDFEGCDEISDGETSPCYVSANGGDPRVQHTRRLLDNVLHVPQAIFHGAADELVPYTGEARQVERLAQLGYRHRLYTFPAQEHYGPPVQDEWEHGARYLHSFVRQRDPARVVYVRDMPFERATERIQSDGIPLDFTFDRSFWMAGLEPVDPEAGVARFVGRSLAIPELPVASSLELAGPAEPGQTGPFLMTGLAWRPSGQPAPEPANAFEARLRGARAVRLDARRMRLDATRRIAGELQSDVPFELALRGPWRSGTVATLGGRRVEATRAGGLLRVAVPAGAHRLEVFPPRR